MVPLTNEIFITDAPLTEKILNICQAIFIHRFRRQYVEEEYVFMLLIDIMRTPETIKVLSMTSIKEIKKPEDETQSDTD
jgi:hypothetical protein